MHAHELVQDDDDHLSGEVTETEHTIQDKIKHTLTIYPRVSPSMLQVGIGTALPPSIWKPILKHMIDSGMVVSESVRAETPSKRQQVYTVLSLKPVE